MVNEKKEIIKNSLAVLNDTKNNLARFHDDEEVCSVVMGLDEVIRHLERAKYWNF